MMRSTWLLVLLVSGLARAEDNWLIGNLDEYDAPSSDVNVESAALEQEGEIGDISSLLRQLQDKRGEIAREHLEKTKEADSKRDHLEDLADDAESTLRKARAHLDKADAAVAKAKEDLATSTKQCEVVGKEGFSKCVAAARTKIVDAQAARFSAKRALDKAEVLAEHRKLATVRAAVESKETRDALKEAVAEAKA